MLENSIIRKNVKFGRCIYKLWKNLLIRRLSRGPCRAPLLFACPPRYRFFIFLHIGPAPCRQTKNRPLGCSNGMMLYKNREKRNDANGKRGRVPNVMFLSNMAWFWKYWICFLYGIIEDGWKIWKWKVWNLCEAYCYLLRNQIRFKYEREFFRTSHKMTSDGSDSSVK